MTITTADVKNLREMTGAGILDCKKALQETNGQIEQAVEYLRKKGLATAAKKSSREAKEGVVRAYISPDGRTAVMVEVNCETDFVARTEDFQTFAASLVRQMAEQPGLTNVEELLAAPYLDNPANSITQQLTEMIAKLGENLVVRRVARFDLNGDGMLDSYIHIGGRVGVVVEVAGGEAGNSQFAALAHDLALQIAATAPRYVTETEIPAAETAAEKSIYRAQLADDPKSDHIKEKIIEGKLKKWHSEVTLLNQQFVKNPDLTIAQLLKQHSKALGREITARRFARFELGA